MLSKNVLKNQGFTLIEILVVIGLIAVLAGIVLIAINPARQFAQARNSQRTSNVETILNAIGQNLSDNKGTFNCAAGAIPATTTPMESTGGYDIRSCLVTTYVSEIPVDPTIGTAWNGTSYDTGYQVSENATTKRITVSASSTELGGTIISLTR